MMRLLLKKTKTKTRKTVEAKARNCVFCGREATIYESPTKDFTVMCLNNICRIKPIAADFRTAATALAWWNQERSKKPKAKK